MPLPVSACGAAFFLGGTPRLQAVDAVLGEGDRFELQTVSTGVVHLTLEVLSLGFHEVGVRT